jgi:hypothetical protein
VIAWLVFDCAGLGFLTGIVIRELIAQRRHRQWMKDYEAETARMLRKMVESHYP